MAGRAGQEQKKKLAGANYLDNGDFHANDYDARA